MTHEKLKAAFVQGGEREASEVFNELIRGSVREAFWQMMSEEVDTLRCFIGSGTLLDFER